MAISEYEVFGVKAGGDSTSTSSAARHRPIRLPPLTYCVVCGKRPTMDRSTHCDECEHGERLALRRWLNNQTTPFELLGKHGKGGGP